MSALIAGSLAADPPFEAALRTQAARRAPEQVQLLVEQSPGTLRFFQRFPPDVLERMWTCVRSCCPAPSAPVTATPLPLTRAYGRCACTQEAGVPACGGRHSRGGGG